VLVTTGARQRKRGARYRIEAEAAARRELGGAVATDDLEQSRRPRTRLLLARRLQ
jgi:hypothetical protein